MACNTATSAAIKHLREKFPLIVIGTEPGIKPAILNNENINYWDFSNSTTLKGDKYQF